MGWRIKGGVGVRGGTSICILALNRQHASPINRSRGSGGGKESREYER